jgi:hypothetical protein
MCQPILARTREFAGSLSHSSFLHADAPLNHTLERALVKSSCYAVVLSTRFHEVLHKVDVPSVREHNSHHIEEEMSTTPRQVLKPVRKGMEIDEVWLLSRLLAAFSLVR